MEKRCVALWSVQHNYVKQRNDLDIVSDKIKPTAIFSNDT